MTLTLEIAPEVEAALNEVAAQRGQSVSDYAAQLLADALEDALDVAEADRIMANSDPSKRRTLAELRAALYPEVVIEKARDEQIASRDEQVRPQGDSDLNEAMRKGAEIMAPLYAESLATGGDLTACVDAPGDLHEYSDEELTAMEAGEFDRPLRRAA